MNVFLSLPNIQTHSPGSAIHHVKEKIFVEEKGLRRGVPKVLVVLTDGRSQDEVTKVAKEMQTEGQLGCGLPHSPTHLAPFLSLHPQLLLYHFSHAFAHLPPPFLSPLLLHHIYTCISHSPAPSSAFSLFSFSFRNTTPTSTFFPSSHTSSSSLSSSFIQASSSLPSALLTQTTESWLASPARRANATCSSWMTWMPSR